MLGVEGLGYWANKTNKAHKPNMPINLIML